MINIFLQIKESMDLQKNLLEKDTKILQIILNYFN
jgi:hypothetical protein